MKLGVNKTVNLEMRSVGVKHVDGGSSKITRPTSQPSNPINKTSTEVQVKKSPPTNDVGETNNDIIKVGLISARLVSAFLIDHNNSYHQNPCIFTEKADHVFSSPENETDY